MKQPSVLSPQSSPLRQGFAGRAVLITGGAGFIGSHLSAFALRKGYRVIVIDNLITGREENLANLHSNPNFTFIKADITKLQANQPPLFTFNFPLSHVFHLASPASPPKYQHWPIETLRVNSLGTELMLELAKNNQARFIYASTSEVYGDPAIHPQVETYWGNVNSFGPRSCYDEAKRYGEAMCYTYLNNFNVDVRVARIFNTYGPHMDPTDGRVISNLVNQAIKNKPLTIYGDGTQTRSFCYVADLVKGLWKLATKEVTGEVINLGNPNEITMDQVAEIIKDLSESKSEIIYKALPADDPKRRQPDISKAKQLLDWQPEVKLEDGLLKTIKYFRQL